MSEPTSTLTAATTTEQQQPSFPMHLMPSELVECAYQVLLFAIGTPINLLALRRLWLNSRRGGHQSESRLVLLTLHLTIANLLALIIYCLWRTYWQVRVVWHDGDALCKVYSFMAVFPFHLWSNLVAAIALDMLCCIRSPLASYRSGTSRAHWLISAAYGVAALCSCVIASSRGTVRIEYPLADGSSKPLLSSSGAELYQCYTTLESQVGKRVMNVFHVLSVFYLPLCTIVGCYVAIGLSLRKQMHAREQLLVGQHARPPARKAHSYALSGGVGELVSTPACGGASPRTTARRELFRLRSVIVSASHSSLNSTCSSNRPRSRSGRQSATASSQSRQRNSLRRGRKSAGHTKRRFLRQTVAIIATFVLSWLPYQLLAGVSFFCAPGGGCSQFVRKMYWVQVVMIASACVNPFLYRFSRPRPKTNLQKAFALESAALRPRPIDRRRSYRRPAILKAAAVDRTQQDGGLLQIRGHDTRRRSSSVPNINAIQRGLLAEQ